MFVGMEIMKLTLEFLISNSSNFKVCFVLSAGSVFIFHFHAHDKTVFSFVPNIFAIQAVQFLQLLFIFDPSSCLV